MMFGSLVIHGLSAFIVCKGIIEKRLRRFILTLTVLSLSGVVVMELADSKLNVEIDAGIYWAFPIASVITILAVSAYWLVISLVEKVFNARLNVNNQPPINKLVEIYRRSN